MIKIQFNDEIISLKEEQTLADMLLMRGYVEGHFATAINQRFVPRVNYAATILHEGDVIEIISPMQGG